MGIVQALSRREIKVLAAHDWGRVCMIKLQQTGGYHYYPASGLIR